MTPKAKGSAETTVKVGGPYPPVAKSDDPRPVEVAPGQFVTPVAPLPNRGECVVDDGTLHVGRAVNGVVCSAHAMRYKPDGTLRP